MRDGTEPVNMRASRQRSRVKRVPGHSQIPCCVRLACLANVLNAFAPGENAQSHHISPTLLLHFPSHCVPSVSREVAEAVSGINGMWIQVEADQIRGFWYFWYVNPASTLPEEGFLVLMVCLSGGEACQETHALGVDDHLIGR